MNDIDPLRKITPPPAPAAPPVSTTAVTPDVAARTDKKPFFSPKAIGMALGGMILGALVGIVVQRGVESTGLLGPGLDALISEQAAGFQMIDAKLAELSDASDAKQIELITTDLNALFQEQQAIAQRTEDELRAGQQEINRLKQELLATKGAATGANLWLKPGESATIGSSGDVFALRRQDPYKRVGIGVLGQEQLLQLGEFVELPIKDSELTIKIYYKQAEARSDGRIGFDVVIPTE